MCRCQDIPALALVGQVRETEENKEDNRYHPDEDQVALQDFVDFDLNEIPKMLAPKAVIDLLAHLNLDMIKLGLKRALADRGDLPVLGQEGSPASYPPDIVEAAMERAGQAAGRIRPG